MRPRDRLHFVEGHLRYTACGRAVTLDEPKPHDVAPHNIVRRDRVDLVALVAVTCRVCQKVMRAEDLRVREMPEVHP